MLGPPFKRPISPFRVQRRNLCPWSLLLVTFLVTGKKTRNISYKRISSPDRCDPGTETVLSPCSPVPPPKETLCTSGSNDSDIKFDPKRKEGDYDTI